MQKDLEYEAEFEQSPAKSKGGLDKDAISKRLEEIYKRLEFIDADAAEARAASILAVCFFVEGIRCLLIFRVCTICTIRGYGLLMLPFSRSSYLDHTCIILSNINTCLRTNKP